jgi:hypothetical protein
VQSEALACVVGRRYHVSESILFFRRVAALGYQFLVRASLAAVASLGSSAGAVAGAIEGVVTFPAQLVPSMTVYVSGLDNSRVHSVQLLRGQASFTVRTRSTACARRTISTANVRITHWSRSPLPRRRRVPR